MKNLFSNLRGDLFGGITAGVVALPLALAFGVSSGLGPTAGLYGAIFLSFFAALFGGTQTQISGPTAPMTAVSMVVIAGILAINDGDVEKALPSILLVFLLAGLMQIILGILGLGRYIRYIPYPVISGFMTAIGLIIILTQILPGILVLEDFKETIARSQEITESAIQLEAQTLAGSAASGVLGTFKALPRAVRNISWIELLLCLVTIGIIYGFARVTTSIPSTLAALLLVSVAAHLLKLDYRPIEEIPQGLPLPEWRVFTEINMTTVTAHVFTALTLALLGAIDSLLTSVVADNMTKTRHKPNRELIGQGIGNSIAAVFG
ncbi:MAG: SulP family inorganic anion transporter, partial [Robiginitalea sp.]